jgi:hypothetical protein
MEELTKRLLQTTKKKLFRTQPVYETRAYPIDEELSAFEAEHGVRFPGDLRYWLLSAGFGEFRDEILIDPCWFDVIETGEAKGHFIFAQDGLGNFYSFSGDGGGIYFLSRKTPEWACVAGTFQQFLEDLERRDFDVCHWALSLDLEACEWSE